MENKIFFILTSWFITACNLFSEEIPVNKWAILPENNASVDIPAQKSQYFPKKRTIKVYIYYPGETINNVNNLTGLFLTLHNWGGTEAKGAPSPFVLSSRYNTICIAVDYLQSGASTDKPYDFGYMQGLDVLRALYFVSNALKQKGISFAKHRIYCSGGSGGGNVSLMANKLAPRTFACVVDLSGMASLTDDIAFNLPGGSCLKAGYSKNPEHPYYLNKDMKQIRDIGNSTHLSLMKKLENSAKIVVIHGVKDSFCLVSDKKRVVKNMQKAGLDIDAIFIESRDIDDELIKDAGHGIGDRTKLLIKFADKYLSKINENKKNDFECKDENIKYKTSNGYYIISYKRGYPVGKFVPKSKTSQQRKK